MISIRKFWTYVILECFVMVSLCVYGESVKTVTPIAPSTKKYEINSEILNFDYTEMAFPYHSGNIGIKTDKGIKKPEKRNPVKSSIDEPTYVKDGVLMFISVIFIAVGCLGLALFSPFLLFFVAKVIKMVK